MSRIPGGPLQTPRELKAQIEAEREGIPMLVYRDGTGDQRIVRLSDGVARLIVGREEGVDLRLDWDVDVSRVHAQLERFGEVWTVADDGLSRNGTFLNGERVVGRRKLEDRDMLRFGTTTVVYRHPIDTTEKKTALAADPFETATLTDAQRRVLVALSRPFKDQEAYAMPATNQEIADELFLSLPAVKSQLRSLFIKFGIDDLPQNQKRQRLVELAFRSGAIALRDL